MRRWWAAGVVLMLGLPVGGLAWGKAVGRDAATRQATIAFSRDDRLYLMNADGSKLRRLPVGPVDFFVWSPDGRKLAFSLRERRARLYVAEADGSNRRPLTPPRSFDCLWAAWSPDGRQLAFTRNDGCEGFLGSFVVNADGSGHRRLTLRRGDHDPVWSPDGREILITSYGESRSRLFLIRPDGSGRRVIRNTRPKSPLGVPTRPPAAWSKDGKRIFFIGSTGEDTPGSRSTLYVINRDGSRLSDLTPGLDVVSFALSPGKRKIAIAAGDGRIRQIYVLNLDGSALRQLTRARGVVNSDPQWSPDGMRIAFTRRTAQYGVDIYVFKPDGTGLAKATRNPAVEDWPSWRPHKAP